MRKNIILTCMLSMLFAGSALPKSDVKLNASEDKSISDTISFVKNDDFTVNSALISSSNASNTNHVLISEEKAKLTDTITLETTLSINQTGDAGFVFGVKDNGNVLENGYYELTYNNEYFSLNSHVIGGLGTNNHKVKYQTTTDLNIKLILTSTSKIILYANEDLIYEIFDYEYQGGYFGFINKKGEATYSNYSISMLHDEIALENITIDELDFIYIPYLYGYDYPITEYKDVSVKVTPKSGYEVSINGVKTNELTVSLSKDNPTIEITASNGTKATNYFINTRIGYNDTYRPSYHVSPERGFCNDPNGLVYDESTGLYHMFYQYTRTINSDVLGNKNVEGDGSTASFVRYWGHCISRDLINWKNMPIALSPYDRGNIFSGSVVVDKDNTSGLFDETDSTASRLVAIYTWSGPNWHHPISISYSTDWGVTWTNHGIVFDGSNDEYGDYRDPKVSYYEDETLPNGGTWMMVFGGWTQIHIMTSPNLIDWKFNSKCKGFDGKEFIGECPDLAKVKSYDGSYKYVLTLAGEYYIIGDIKKDNEGNYYFEALTPSQLLYNSKIIANKTWNKGCPYAGVTFNHEKYNRSIMVSWMVDYLSDYVDDKYWNGYFTVPVEITINKLNGMYYLEKNPIEEVKTLRKDKLIEIADYELTPESSNILSELNEMHADIDFKFTLKGASKVTLTLLKSSKDYYKVIYDVKNATMTIDYSSSGINCPWEDFNPKGTFKASLLPVDNQISLRVLLDKLAIDAYANNGMQVFYSYFWQNGDSKMDLKVEGGNIIIDSLTIYSMGGTR